MKRVLLYRAEAECNLHYSCRSEYFSVSENTARLSKTRKVDEHGSQSLIERKFMTAKITVYI